MALEKIALPHVATPDNTPTPGGGRWAWDAKNFCWTDMDAPVSIDAPSTDPQTETNPE